MKLKILTRSRNLSLLATHNDHLLALQKVLGDDGAHAAQQMGTGVDQDGGVHSDGWCVRVLSGWSDIDSNQS